MVLKAAHSSVSGLASGRAQGTGTENGIRVDAICNSLAAVLSPALETSLLLSPIPAPSPFPDPVAKPTSLRWVLWETTARPPLPHPAGKLMTGSLFPVPTAHSADSSLSFEDGYMGISWLRAPSHLCPHQASLPWDEGVLYLQGGRGPSPEPSHPR